MSEKFVMTGIVIVAILVLILIAYLVFLTKAMMKFGKEFGGLAGQPILQPKPVSATAIDTATTMAATQPINEGEKSKTVRPLIGPDTSKGMLFLVIGIVVGLLLLTLYWIGNNVWQGIDSAPEAAKAVKELATATTPTSVNSDVWWSWGYLSFLIPIVVIVLICRHFFTKPVVSTKKTISAGGFWGFSVNLIDSLTKIILFLVVTSAIVMAGIPLLKFFFGPAEPPKQIMVQMLPGPTKKVPFELKAGEEMSLSIKSPIDYRLKAEICTKVPSFYVSFDGGEWQACTATRKPVLPDDPSNIIIKATQDMKGYYYYSPTPGGPPAP